MSSLWDVPQYLIMAFSLALDAPVEKASRDAHLPPAAIAVTTQAAVPTENAWLRAVKTAAPQSDILQGYAARIFVTSSGQHYVPTPVERIEILSLRLNQGITTRVVAAATVIVRAKLRQEMHREPSRAALVVAHVQGEVAALAYMRELGHHPQARLVQTMPELARWAGGDGALTLAQFDARLSRAVTGAGSEIATNADAESLKGTLTKQQDEAGSGQMASR